MSAQQLPPLCRSTQNDFESDSDYLGTPIDPPSACHPHVAEYGPLCPEYFYPGGGFESAEYGAGHGRTQFNQASDSAFVGASVHQGLLLQNTYPITIPDGCNQPSAADTAIAAYQMITPNHLPVNVSGGTASSYLSRGSPETSTDVTGSSFGSSRRTDSSLTQQIVLPSLHYTEYEEEDSGSSDASIYPKVKQHQSDLTCDTAVSYPLSDTHSYSGMDPSAFVGNATYVSKAYYEDRYADSPIDDHSYCDRFSDQGATYDRPGYEHFSQHPQPQPNTHFGASSLQGRSSIRFYQPPACPYSYPCIDTTGGESGYGSSPVSPSSSPYGYAVIHAPRPQQLHDLHTLHNNTCVPKDTSSSFASSHHVLSIPSIPAPPPIPRPSSLIEDSPKKPLTLACFFCRKRKIACQSPPANAQDRTCNQCAKRKLKCVYPATSRRGIRPRVYDLADEPFRRPSVALSH